MLSGLYKYRSYYPLYHSSSIRKIYPTSVQLLVSEDSLRTAVSLLRRTASGLFNHWHNIRSVRQWRSGKSLVPSIGDNRKTAAALVKMATAEIIRNGDIVSWEPSQPSPETYPRWCGEEQKICHATVRRWGIGSVATVAAMGEIVHQGKISAAKRSCARTSQNYVAVSP